MKIDQIKTIAIAGAGTMGQGIAQLISNAGYETLWYDVDANILDKALKKVGEIFDKGIELNKTTKENKEKALNNITLTTNINDLEADLIIEAIVEKLSAKLNFFEALEKFNSPTTLFATNTSSIPITTIASNLQHPERFIGMHFFNPAHIMKLIEVIYGAETLPEIGETIFELAKKLGKIPVKVKDSPGFIVNRVARHYYVESLKILEENVADIETIDKLLESSGFKKGPFRLMDLIGLDTNFAVTKSIYNSFHQDPKFRPSRIQEQKVNAGHYGIKTKKGFYEY